MGAYICELKISLGLELFSVGLDGRSVAAGPVSGPAGEISPWDHSQMTSRKFNNSCHTEIAVLLTPVYSWDLNTKLMLWY